MDVIKLVEDCGEPYSKMLGIDLNGGDPAYVMWLLASILYAKPIREESATKTFMEFKAAGLVDARTIVSAGWDRLVEVLDKGGYTRYDFSTADRLLEIFGNLLKNYRGSLQRLYDLSGGGKDIERRIMGLGKGIGPVTISIYLRDMQLVWPGAKPMPTARIKKAAESLGIRDVRTYAGEHGLGVVELETALHRYSRAGKAKKPKCIRPHEV